MNQLVQWEIDTYLVISETKCFYQLQLCKEIDIVSFYCDTEIKKFELVDVFRKVKKSNTRNPIKLDIENDFIIYDESTYSLIPKKLKSDTDKNKLIKQLLKDARYERIFEFWNLSYKFKDMNNIPERRLDMFKELLDEFKPYSEDIFKITNFKL